MKSLYTQLVANVLFPAHELLKGHDSVAVRRRLESSQWWAPAEHEKARSARLQAFMRRIGDDVPYYRKMFAELGISADEITDIEALQPLPFLTKDLIRGNADELVAGNSGPLVTMNTGGSTGEPMVFRVGRERISHDIAAKWRATRWWDVDIGDPEYVIWGSPIELGKQDRVKAIRDRLLRTKLFSAFAMSEEWIDDLLRTIRLEPPRMLFGYPSALALLAEKAESKSFDLADLGIKVAFVTAEKCYPYQRELIGRVFGCPVANGYGGRDAGFIAHECPSGSMHLSSEDIVVEIVGPDGVPVAAGTSGEIVVTHLATGDFPFVRYRTGDVGTLSAASCACGRTLPVLEEISGRSTDFIRACDGTLMHGLALIYVLRELPGIDAFKIIQESETQVRVLVIPGDAYDEAVERQITAGFRQRLGEDMRIIIDRVGHIEPEKSGKYRYVVSQID